MIIAKVNGYEITEEEFNAELKIIIKKSHVEQPSYKIKKVALGNLIDGYLVLQSAEKAKIEISQIEIDDKLIDIMLKFNTQEEFKQVLYDHDLDTDKIKKKIKNDLLIEKYYQQNFPTTIEITIEKLKEVYQENLNSFKTEEMVEASHILIKDHTSESLKKLKEIRIGIKSPEDFKKEAKICSECPSNCKEGSLGYFTKGKMVKEFDEIAFSMNVNEISEPIKTQFGYHIIMITDKKKQTFAKFDQVKGALEKRLKQIDRELKLIRHLKALRAKADITINEDLF